MITPQHTITPNTHDHPPTHMITPPNTPSPRPDTRLFLTKAQEGFGRPASQVERRAWSLCLRGEGVAGRGALSALIPSDPVRLRGPGLWEMRAAPGTPTLGPAALHICPGGSASPGALDNISGPSRPRFLHLQNGDDKVEGGQQGVPAHCACSEQSFAQQLSSGLALPLGHSSCAS